jgi:hypothetical protein
MKFNSLMNTKQQNKPKLTQRQIDLSSRTPVERRSARVWGRWVGQVRQPKSSHFFFFLNTVLISLDGNDKEIGESDLGISGEEIGESDLGISVLIPWVNGWRTMNPFTSFDGNAEESCAGVSVERWRERHRSVKRGDRNDEESKG